MTTVDELYRKDCKIDAEDVNAYIDLSLKDNDPTFLHLESSWGVKDVDLKPAVKGSETQTTLKLTPDEEPEYLEYDGENGEPQCISGDDLSRLISLMKLKDVDQSYTPSNGDILIYDGTTNLFKVTNLPDALAGLQAQITELLNQITAMNSTINNYGARISTIETTLAKPTGIPNNAVVAWGNLNCYGDNTNNNVKTSGIYTHDPSNDVENDLFFA